MQLVQAYFPLSTEIKVEVKDLYLKNQSYKNRANLCALRMPTFATTSILTHHRSFKTNQQPICFSVSIFRFICVKLMKAYLRKPKLKQNIGVL